MIDPRQVADALVAAERERKPIAPFTDMYPFLDAGRAYQAQRLFVEDHACTVAEFDGLGAIEVYS